MLAIILGLLGNVYTNLYVHICAYIITYITLAMGGVGPFDHWNSSTGAGAAQNAQEYVYGNWHRALSCLYSGCLSCTIGF